MTSTIATWTIPTAVNYINATTILLLRPIIMIYCVLIAIKIVFLMVNTL